MSKVSMEVDILGGKTKVNKVSITVPSFVQAASRSKSVQDRALENFENAEAKAIERKVQRHYDNLLKQIRDILKSGIAGAGKGGSPTIYFTGPDGKNFSIDTEWDDLNEKYRKRKKKLYRGKFWRANATSKGAPLFAAYSAIIDSSSATKVKLDKVSIDKRFGVKNTRNGAQMKINTRIRIDPLPTPLDDLVRKPFLSGDAGSSSTSGRLSANRFDISKILFAEGRRPFVKEMSAIAGNFMLNELSNIS